MARSPKTPAPSKPGFEEAPQSAFEGAPLSGCVADWVKQLEADAEASTVESRREVASKAGKHRKQVENAARQHSEKVEAAARAKRSGQAAVSTNKKTTSQKTSRGVSIGASSDPKTRAAAGLNPVAGMDMSLEEAQSLAPGAVTATVELHPKDGGGFQLAVALDAETKGLDQAAAEALIAAAHQICPYSNATRGNIDVAVSVTAA